MSMLHLRQKPYTRLAKRAFDLVVASLGLLLMAPLLPFLVLLVRLTPGPVVYRQTRVGEGGRHFTILKLRTMRAGRGGRGLAALHAGRRRPRHERRPDPAPDAPRRAAAALERAPGRDVDRRAAPGTTRVRRPARADRPVLDAAPAREARDHRLGAASLRLRVRRRERRREALVRPLVPAQPQRRRRSRHLLRDRLCRCSSDPGASHLGAVQSRVAERQLGTSTSSRRPAKPPRRLWFHLEEVQLSGSGSARPRSCSGCWRRSSSLWLIVRSCCSCCSSREEERAAADEAAVVGRP